MTTLDTLVSVAIEKTRRTFDAIDPPVVDHIFYGAIDLDPQHLVVWFAFANDAAVTEAKTRGHTTRIRRELKKTLREAGYPPDALPKIHIGFVGKQEVDAAGGPWVYFH